MDVSASCLYKNFGDTGCKLSVDGPSCNPEVDHPKSTSLKIKYSTEVAPSHIDEKDDLMFQAARSPGFVMHITEVGELSSDFASASNQNEQDESEANDQEYFHFVRLDVNKKKALSKSATFPCSEDLQCDDGADLSNSEIQSNYSSHPDSSLYTRSLSLPGTFELVSAMKGSRARHGSSPTIKLSVKWAPDVYDPPATSMSHTLKKSHNHRQRAKKKESGKYKQNKGKSSRGNSERKSASHSSSCMKLAANVDMRSKAVVDRLIMTGCSNSDMGPLEYAVSSQDSKCGSSLLGGLAKIHISMGEAS